MRSRRTAELALAGITIVWGTTFVLVKTALEDVSALLFLALRFSLAAIVLAALYRKSFQRQAVWPGVGAGILLFMGYLFQTKGLELTSASNSAFLTGLTIPLVPFFSSLVYKIRPRLSEAAGILTASAGMALITLPPGRFVMNRGDFLSVLCAAVFALHIVVIGHYSRLLGFETVASVQVMFAAALSLIGFRMAGPVRFQMTGRVAVAVLVTGLFATALAFTVMAWSQQYTTATRSAAIFTLEPVVAWFTSWILAGETMGIRGTCGAALILAGVLLVALTGRSETYGPRETSQC